MTKELRDINTGNGQARLLRDWRGNILQTVADCTSSGAGCTHWGREGLAMASCQTPRKLPAQRENHRLAIYICSFFLLHCILSQIPPLERFIKAFNTCSFLEQVYSIQQCVPKHDDMNRLTKRHKETNRCIANSAAEELAGVCCNRTAHPSH